MTTNALPTFDLESFLPYRFTVLAAKLSAELANRYRAEFGISIPEWRVLVNVGYAKDLSVRDIEKRVSLEKSKVSRAAAKLENKGLILKRVDPSDRRLLKMHLTEEGAVLLQKLIPIAQAFQTELDAALGGQGRDLKSALDSLQDGMSDRIA